MAAAPSINVVGANDKIVIGVVGLLRQCDIYFGYMVARGAIDGEIPCRLGGIAEVSKYSRIAFEGYGLKSRDCPAFADYRELLQVKDIDAIVCSVEDFWHAPVILDALAAGKHVYVIPPLCRYLPEVFAIWDACKRTNKIVQVGVQGCSDLKWHKAAELIQGGKIGPVVMVQGSYMRNAPKGEWNYAILPHYNKEDVNWDNWTRKVVGAAKEYNAEEFFRWQKYYRYSAGLSGRLLPHKIYPSLLALGNPGFPVRVAAMGNNKVNTDAKNPGAAKREVPEVIQVIADLSNGTLLHFTSSSVNEQGIPEMIRGQEASLLLGGNKVVLNPEPAFVKDPKPESFGPFKSEDAMTHFRNWLDSIQGKKKPNCGIDLAVRAQTLLCLAEMSDRLNTVCLFDEATRKVHDGLGQEIKPISA